MTTTDLTKIWQRIEKGASGRSREISFTIKNENGLRSIYAPKIELKSTGDGIAGAECSFLITPQPLLTKK